MRKFDIVKIIPNPYFIKVHEGENITEIIDKHEADITEYYTAVFENDGFREIKSTVHEAHEYGFFEELESERTTYYKRMLHAMAKEEDALNADRVIVAEMTQRELVSLYIQDMDQNGDWTAFESLSEVIRDLERFIEAL